MTDQQNPDVEGLRAALKTACDTLEEFSGFDSVLVSPERLRKTREAIGALQVLWQAALRPSPSREEPPDLRKLGKAREQFVTGSPHWLAINDAYSEIVLLRSQLAALRPASSGGAWRPTHRHVKRGTEYRLIGRGIVQTSEPLNDDEYVMIYEGQDGSLWARDADEWSDGRFEALSAPPADPVRA